MTNNLKHYLSKTYFSSIDLKKLIILNIVFKPFYLSKKLTLLSWLEIDLKGLEKNQIINENLIKENLFFIEKLLPVKQQEISKFLGYRIENILNKKINHSRLSLKFRKTILIYWLELIGSYRGWRHMHGLPVRGQRTWTNAWSVYKSNLDLREFIIDLTKNIYKASNISSNDLRLAYMAEHVNKVWSVQWELEWRKAKKKRVQALKKNLKHYTIDLVRLASGNVNTKKIRKNRKKQAEEKKNLFYLGFDKGFTKYLIENNTLLDFNKKKIMKNKKISKITKPEKITNNKKLSIIFKQETKQIKKKTNTKKKKIELQAKKRKNILLKKKKKSVWD